MWEVQRLLDLEEARLDGLLSAAEARPTRPVGGIASEVPAG
jgi:hypothetical protein